MVYKNEEDRKRWSKEYYQKNREKRIEYSKQRHLINREENLKKMRARYKDKKGSTKQSLESISLPGEIWKSIVVDGKVHPWYSVSTMGRVASHFGNKPKSTSKYVPGRGAGFKGWDRSYDPEYCRLIKPAPSYKNNHDPNKRDVYGNTLKVGDKIIMCTRVSIRFPWNFFKDINMYGSEYQYPIQGLESAMNGKCCQRTMAIHKLVANTHMSVDNFPPERIASVYAYLPEEVKQWIRETVVINHIDHDPTNNDISNLEYVTPRENCHKAVEQYGGHFCPDQYLKHKKPVIVEEKKPIYQNALAELLGCESK
tara:strand:+ start:49 stop:981 length:933 start_codon:yes stop_codon:yes gene_type:complete